MTKSAYKIKHLIWGSQFQGVVESVTIVAGSVAVGRHDAGAAAESAYLSTSRERLSLKSPTK